MKWLKKILGISDIETKLDAYEEIIKQILVELKEINRKIDFIGEKTIQIPLQVNEVHGEVEDISKAVKAINFDNIIKRIDKAENRIKRYINKRLKK
jgi:methyl-accepting chemotaxis protein